MPAFADARVEEMLAAARDAGLTPKSDTELLPVLLELVGGHTPVEAWPTQIRKRRRTTLAREAAQGQAAASDRPTPSTTASDQPPGRPDAGPSTTDTADTAGPAVVTPLRWPDHARQAAAAVDHERRRRRERVMTGQAPTPPPRLGEQARRAGLLVLPDDEPHDQRGDSPRPGGTPTAGLRP